MLDTLPTSTLCPPHDAKCTCLGWSLPLPTRHFPWHLVATTEQP
jgi:hypothetical protein